MGESVLSRPFERREGVLHCGDVDAGELARRFGTPLYVYDIRHIEAHVRRFQQAFAGVDHIVAYSVKANGNLAILRRLCALGCGADITSAGELFRARKAGIPMDRTMFAGVGKKAAEMREALLAGIHSFNVESASELRRLDEVAADLGLRAPFALRVNPDVVAATHEYVATGHATTKFGVPYRDAIELYEWAAGRPNLWVRGIDMHIGSQIVDTAPYLNALERVLGLTVELKRAGHRLEYVDIGGGYGIAYDDGPELDVERLASDVTPRVREAGLRLVLEPGRSVAGDAGVLLTRVEYVKRAGKTFVIVDAGMTDLIRPSLYKAFHAIERVDMRRHNGSEPVDVVGPVCETGDFLARDRTLDVPEAGELLAVRTVGAYGFTMASNYNGRPRPAECMVDGSEVTLIRRRETLEDLVRLEEPELEPTPAA